MIDGDAQREGTGSDEVQTAWFGLEDETKQPAEGSFVGVVVNRPIEQVPRLSKIPVVEVLLAGPKLWIYRLKNSMPRVTFSLVTSIVTERSAMPAPKLGSR